MTKLTNKKLPLIKQLISYELYTVLVAVFCSVQMLKSVFQFQKYKSR